MPYYDSTNYDVDQSFGFLVVTVSALISDDLNGQLNSKLGLNLSQWRALATLRHGGAVTASELCQELRYDSGAMTRMIDKLSVLGLVERQPTEGDRRANRLALTKKGRAICNDGHDLARRRLNIALDDLTKPESRQLIALLQSVKRTLLARQESQHPVAAE